MKPKSILAVIFFLMFSFTFHSSFAVKKWNNYTDLKNVTCLAVDKNSTIAYCGTSGGLFVVNLSNNTITKEFTNIEGLININITSLLVDNNNMLWIGASDGSICVYDNSSSTFRYIFDIKNSTESDKTVNGFVNYGNYIFVATGFGIIKISTVTYNFVDAPYYQLGTFTQKSKVYDLTILNNTLYSATVSGVAFASLINTNLNNPASWSNYFEPPLNGNVKTIKNFDGKVFAGGDNGFMYYDGSLWIEYPDTNYSRSSIKSISGIGNRLYFISNNKTYSADKNSLNNVIPFNTNDNCNIVISDNGQMPLLGIYEKGLFVSGNYVVPNCPNRSSFNSIVEDNKGNVWGASGLNDGGFYKFDGNTWTTYTNDFFPELGSSNNFRMMISGNNTIWALNFGNGLVSITDNTIRLYNGHNTNLPGIDQGSPYFCVPSGGAYDNNGMFWVAFYRTNSSKSVYAKTDDTNWTGFTNPSVLTNGFFENMAIDNYNTKWVVLSRYSNVKGLYFLNENNTIGNPSDDIMGRYDVSDFSVQNIYYVVVDKGNVVWIATNNGVFTIDNPLAAIQNPSSPPAPQKVGIISGNLKVPFTESSTSIAVDVLNEKWIGTESNGVFHLSEDGSTLIETFNVTNSPILSNAITSIVVSGVSGRAYFGTLNGLSSVQTNAIQPVSDFDKIICKPNPYIIPSSKNPTLTIDGLVENSTIKIITLNGEVVAEYTARQGKIDDQWNGTDKKGKLVPTGIYIVVAYNKDGSKVGTGKLAVIRK